MTFVDFFRCVKILAFEAPLFINITVEENTLRSIYILDAIFITRFYFVCSHLVQHVYTFNFILCFDHHILAKRQDEEQRMGVNR